MSAEDKVAAAEVWFATIRNQPATPSGLAPYRTADLRAPLDLTHITQTVHVGDAISVHRCDHCHRGIHVGHPVVSYRPLVTHHHTLHYHESCVVLP